MEKFVYKRAVNYYETDRMGIVHHSNYARYLEECRVKLMKTLEMPLDMLEAMGYMIPVVDLKCTFREPARFGETLLIVPKIEKVTPARFYISYIIYDETGKNIKHIAETSHCFIDRDFNIVSLKKKNPELFEKLVLAQGGQDA